jgi:hypothetical protein
VMDHHRCKTAMKHQGVHGRLRLGPLAVHLVAQAS